MRRELIESYYEEYQQELERFLESDPEMFSLEAEIHHYIDILEPVLRDAGQEMWQHKQIRLSVKVISHRRSLLSHLHKKYLRFHID